MVLVLVDTLLSSSSLYGIFHKHFIIVSQVVVVVTTLVGCPGGRGLFVIGRGGCIIFIQVVIPK